LYYITLYYFTLLFYYCTIYTIQSTLYIDYSRSLEKFQLKSNSYETAGNGKESYEISNFFERSFGFHYDDTATQYGCATRLVWKNRTGEINYLRSGEFWYRNPEFGRVVTDPSKRGRHGAGYGKILNWIDMNPYPRGDVYQRAHQAYQPSSSSSNNNNNNNNNKKKD
jgi:hypothetical protein